MAFNHVGNCSCPVGDCDCGVDYKKEAIRDKAFKKMKELIPTGIYMIKDSGEILEAKLSYAKTAHTNATYIGSIDDNDTWLSAIEKAFIFHGYMMKERIDFHLRASLMKDFIRQLCDCSGKHLEQPIINAISTLYTVQTVIV